MSGLVCSISGAPLIQPVASSKTGHLYQKSTILHYLSINGKCPHTGTPMEPKDLIELAQKNTNILSSFQNTPLLAEKLTSQMDALVIQTHLLKQNLRERREELATSLYRQDAAIRVIARLKQQRDKARQKISNLMEELRTLQNK